MISRTVEWLFCSPGGGRFLRNGGWALVAWVAIMEVGALWFGFFLILSGKW
ncbi:MAG: hypothetical protein ACYCS8_01745 [Acidithiobacillus sp.]|jgi:hypothetical protein|uniref:hypothetical protein n=1 Tax=Acidithiobacillus ferrooxidans TaxID=920 RepID=UPI000AD67EB6|nr:hypothetical protein [Acidithiobacillus ferrooxidans]